MSDKQETQRYYLLPGEIAFASEHTIISTLLGSCVSVCLYDPVRKVGGLNHYMLPSRGDGNTQLSRGKYGDYAIDRLLAMADKAGCRRTDLVVSVYGGGKVAGHLGSIENLGLFNVSGRNVDLAINKLKSLGLKITRRDIGGECARKISMDSQTGEIKLTQVAKSAENVELAKKLKEFKQRKIKVLVVDDSRMVRKILRSAIESTDDMEVCGEAENPFEARELILQEDPDLISLDVIMPRMDGLTFLRKLAKYKFIPVVVVSTMAKAGSAMRANVLKAGAVYALDKDALAIYKGTELLEKELLPKFRQAAKQVKKG